MCSNELLSRGTQINQTWIHRLILSRSLLHPPPPFPSCYYGIIGIYGVGGGQVDETCSLREREVECMIWTWGGAWGNDHQQNENKWVVIPQEEIYPHLYFQSFICSLSAAGTGSRVIVWPKQSCDNRWLYCILDNMVSPVSVQRWFVALDENVLLDRFPAIHWHLVYDLWPLHSGCCEGFWSGVRRQLMLSVSAVYSSSCPGFLLFHWGSLCSPQLSQVISWRSQTPTPVFRAYQQRH